MTSKLFRSASFTSLLGMIAVATSCITGSGSSSGPPTAAAKKAEANKVVKIKDDPTAFIDASWADSSGKDGKGGVKVIMSPGNRKVMPLRESNFDRKKKGDSSLKKRGDWMLFYGTGSQSLAFEWEWITTPNDKFYGLKWGGAGVAFNNSWKAVDLTGAKYLVMFAKTNLPNSDFDVKIGLQSISKSKGTDKTGKISLREYIDGKILTGNWARAVIPLAAFPDIDKFDVSKVQTVLFDVDGNYPENERVQVLFDNIYASDLDMVTPVENPGYLALDDSVVVVWDKRPGEHVEGFSIHSGGKEIAKAAPNAKEVKIPRSAFGDAKSAKLGIYTLGAAENSSPIKLTVNLGKANTEGATVTVDAASSHDISPYIFGSNFADAKTIKDLGLTSNRSGGNGVSKYNWKRDLSSSAGDWFFLNNYSKPEGAPEEEKGYYTFIKDTLSAGAAVNYTIPMLSYIAKPHPDPGGRYCSFPLSVYKDQEKNDGQGCGNGMKPGGKEKIWDNDPSLASIPNSPEFQKGLVESIKKNFGGAAGKGVKFFTLDNEPGLWNSTQRDVEPKGLSADDLADRSEKYADMIKSVDPDAKVIGFAAWGPMELAGSNVDYTPPGPDGYKHYNEFKNDGDKWSDRKKHGDKPQLMYLLEKFKEFEKKHGKRLIDVIDIHWYPELYGKDSKGNGHRLQDANTPMDSVATPKQFDATREWWDPTFRPSGDPVTGMESWTANKDNGPKMWDPWHPVIPALKKVIEDIYPGTKLAINEFYSGSQDAYSGGPLRAALYGIFMQEDLYMSENWAQPGPRNSAYYAQKLYGNFDNKGSRIKGKFVKTKTTGKDLLTYAARDGGTTFLVLVNKNMTKSTPTTIEMPSAVKDAQVYYLTESLGQRLYPTGNKQSGTSVKLTVPAFSAMLVVMK